MFFFELKKNNYLFFQFIKAKQHVVFGQPAYFLYGTEELCDENQDPRRVM
nr:unnamed protein product [Callosobruchus analis]